MFPHITGKPTAASVIERHPLVAYFTLAYAISWAFELPLAARAQGLITLPIPFAMHYLAAYGPLLAALILTRLLDGADGLQGLTARMIDWRVGWRWIAVAIGSPVAIFAVACVGAPLIDGTWTDIRGLGQVNFLPYLGAVAWPLWFLTFGIGEETGWRGFALRRLQRDHNALTATIILGSLWALWHLPSFWYLPGYSRMGIAGFPGFAFSLIAGAILLTWLFNSTRGSILMLALWHGTFNFFTASTAGAGTVAMIASIVVMVLAGLIVLFFKPSNLSRIQRQMA